jgi:hypothetical protein
MLMLRMFVTIKLKSGNNYLSKTMTYRSENNLQFLVAYQYIFTTSYESATTRPIPYSSCTLR